MTSAFAAALTCARAGRKPSLRVKSPRRLSARDISGTHGADARNADEQPDKEARHLCHVIF